MGFKKLASLSFAVVAQSTAFEADEKYMFIEFVARYGKSYSSIDHHEERFSVFRENLKLINEHNAKNIGFKMGINKFSDLRFEEMPLSSEIQKTSLK